MGRYHFAWLAIGLVGVLGLAAMVAPALKHLGREAASVARDAAPAAATVAKGVGTAGRTAAAAKQRRQLDANIDASLQGVNAQYARGENPN